MSKRPRVGQPGARSGRLVNLGDSFFQYHDNPRSYLTVVANHFGVESYPVELARGASSLDHMFLYQWKLARDGLSSNDRVVIGLTSPIRTYFFEDNHKLCMPACVDDDCPWVSDPSLAGGLWMWSPQQKEAFRQYYGYLHRDDHNLGWLESWLYELNHACAMLGIKAIVIDSFGDQLGTKKVDSSMHANIIRSTGSLDDISRGEHANAYAMEFISKRTDPRMNHMMLRNHDVLSHKIELAWESGELDLTTGFHKGCFDISLARSREWFEENIGFSSMLSMEHLWDRGLCLE